MGGGSTKQQNNADEKALTNSIEHEELIISQLIHDFHINRRIAQLAFDECSKTRLAMPLLEDMLLWIQTNNKRQWLPSSTTPSATPPSSATAAALEPSTTTTTTNPSPPVTIRQFQSKETISELLTNSTGRTFIPLRTNGNGNCLFNAVVLCLRHCRNPSLIHSFQTTFFAPSIHAENIYEDEATAGLQVRLNLADQIDQEWTRSGISSADHPSMSPSGRARAKVVDQPMINAQIDRLRSIKLSESSGQISAAWGDASEDLMSLCKTMRNREHQLKFQVYVGTATQVKSITGTWLDIHDDNKGGQTTKQPHD